ncbi:hypothetical protein GCM10027047_10400 [Rhodococcus aerolatus]
MAANDARDYDEPADVGENDTAERTESGDDSAGGPEPAGAETAGALGAPTPSKDTESAAEPGDES